MGYLRICGTLSFSFSAILVLLASALLGIGGKDGCSSDADCQCAESSWQGFCHTGRCFGKWYDPRCVGKENGHSNGATWCWAGMGNGNCAVRPSPLAGIKDGVLAFLEQQGVRYAKVLPAIGRMYFFPDDREALIKGCVAFQELGWNDPASKEPLMHLGAINVAIAALKRHRLDSAVERACYGSLAALSLYNRNCSLRVGELGGVEMTVDFWRRHFDNPRDNIANYFGCYQDYSVENRVRMKNAGAIQLILEACGEGGKHYWDAGAQFSCWCAFSSFHTPENHAEFRRLGGIRHTAAVFRDHAKGYRVREEILQAMKGVCAWRANRDGLLKEGFFELLADAVKTEKHDPQVTSLGLEVLRMFVDVDAEQRRKYVAAGGVDVAFDALQTHAAALLNTRAAWDSQNIYGDINDNQYNVAGAAAEMLYSLALDGPETRKAMLEAGAIARLDAAIRDTERRVPAVKFRTYRGSCQTLRLLAPEAEALGMGEERLRIYAGRRCPDRDEHPPLGTNENMPFEP